MPFKPNYNMQRIERTRAKEAKKEEKLRARREQAERKAAGGTEGSPDADLEAGADASEAGTRSPGAVAEG